MSTRVSVASRSGVIGCLVMESHVFTFVTASIQLPGCLLLPESEKKETKRETKKLRKNKERKKQRKKKQRKEKETGRPSFYEQHIANNILKFIYFIYNVVLLSCVSVSGCQISWNRN